MGEVGTSSPESKSMSVVNTNGDTNGTYHTGDMEPMDIDDNEFESEVTSVNIIHQSKLSLHSVNGEVDEENHDHDDNGLDKISDNKTNKNSEGRVNESSLNGNGIETLGNGINENNQSDMSKSNGSKQDKEKISLLVEEEIHQILDSDDEPPPEVAKRSNSIKLNSIEPMEVDGLVKKNDVKLVENDADKPVVIQSDSEDEQPTRPTPSLKPINIMEIKKATPTVTPATTVETSKVVPSTPVADDDDDDCVVIEDDDEPKAVPPPIQRNIQRQRKPLSKSRDIDMTDNSLLKIQNKSLDSVGSKDIRNFNLQNQISLLGNQTSVYPLTAANLNQQIPPLASLNQSFQMVAAAAAAAATSALLPALTDDMFVLEAPSFIVPYIYEKPPSDKLEEVVKKLEVDIKSTKEDNAENQHSIDGNDKTLVLDSEDGKEQKVDDKTDGKRKRKRKNENGDDSWDEDNTSTDDEASDTEERTKVLIKEAKSDIEAIKTHIETTNKLDSSATTTAPDGAKKSENFFDSPVGKFFMDIGINLVQEHVQADLLKQQKKLQIRSGKEAPPRMQMAINSLIKNLEMSRDRNEPFKFPLKRCEFCNFKSESALVMAHHYESPHLKNNVYRCNFCPYEARPIHDILFHMEAVHNVKAHMEKAPALHQCPNCLFEDNGRAKLTRHTPVCAKRYRPDMNLVPPVEWEPPAKIPKIRARQGLVGTATAYQAMAAQAQRASVASAAAALQRANASNQNTNRGRNSNGRSNTNKNSNKNVLTPQQAFIQQQQALMATLAAAQMKPHQLTQQQLASMALTANFQINSNSQFVQVPSANITNTMNSLNPYTIQPSKPSTSSSTSSKSQQPSISITPLPRQPSSSLSVTPVQSNSNFNSGGRNSTSNSNLNRSTGNNGGNNFSGSKTNFVICEICDGYIKDLDQLRNHMQWMHKVKIHPKMIYNRPPLNCQKCQFRFFTDQGLERHLLGSHGLVTSSMQEAANKGKDSGRCPVCGKIYQWKLLNHVSTDHGMTLKPAHLSYKCTVCTATFGMYKQFENHVYSAHSSVAKKTVDNKKQSSNNSSMGSSSSSNQQKAALSALAADNALKPLRINDEITIIPQPATSTNFKTNSKGAVVID